MDFSAAQKCCNLQARVQSRGHGQRGTREEQKTRSPVACHEISLEGIQTASESLADVLYTGFSLFTISGSNGISCPPFDESNTHIELAINQNGI